MEIEFGVETTFHYVNHKSRPAIRRAIPQRIYFGTSQYYHIPEMLMEAYDLDKQETRTFAISKMVPEIW